MGGRLRAGAPAYGDPRSATIRAAVSGAVGYGILDGEAYAHGLTPMTGKRRQNWFRAGDDAVLAYCGLVVGCKVTLVAPGRFVSVRQ